MQSLSHNSVIASKEGLPGNQKPSPTGTCDLGAYAFFSSCVMQSDEHIIEHIHVLGGGCATGFSWITFGIMRNHSCQCFPARALAPSIRGGGGLVESHSQVT